jgi:hypothetical protein
MEKITLRFKIKKVFEGLAEANGIIVLDKEQLKIEFQTKDSIFGVLKSGVKDVGVPLNEIEDVLLKKGVFKNNLIIRLSGLSTSAKIPNQDPGEIKLIIDKEYAAEAAAFVSRIKLAVAEYNVKTLNDERYKL